MKTPDLPCPSIAAALRAYSYVLSSLDVRTPWEPLLPSPAYPKLGFTTSQLGLADQSPCLIVVSHVIIAVPYMLSRPSLRVTISSRGDKVNRTVLSRLPGSVR